ncbi:hypothetical protein SAMN02799625_05915 [Methylobacterium sp. UNC300MFChir4.1]|uniref:hypothetical protein n=1 Tax=Methylobacterium sp. UNC300MFChir4.1 TaxID=1502747 RepID=UPI0008AAB72C|nr:hypothetical protein [Methylobacterium sp. UNC300MFChir4.1]SEP39592.1 hypothetical protein SAMN02799625_05915 [Methylobacterium sp. UNC300MFChir4.1]
MAYQIPTAARLVSAPVVCRILTMRQYDPDPAIDARIRRAVRYGQTRWAEIWFSVIMWVVGLTCLMLWPTFVGPQYRIITSYVSESTAGVIALAVGTARITALYINGRRGRETSFIRTLGCLGGFLFWLAMALGFAMAFPPLSLSAGIYSVFAIAELHSSGRAAGDMAAEDTFGFRKRRRASAGNSTAA